MMDFEPMIDFQPGKIYRNVSGSTGHPILYPLFEIQPDGVMEFYTYLQRDETFVALEASDVKTSLMIKVLTESGRISYLLLSKHMSLDSFKEVNDI